MQEGTDSQGTGGLDGHVSTPIDDKGRVIFPKAMREALKADFVIRKGTGPCLEAIRKEVYAAEVQRVNEMPESVWKNQWLRMLRGTAFSGMNADPQGRVVIPQILRVMQRLTDRAILVGVGEKVELWNPEDWHKWLQDARHGEESAIYWDEVWRKMRLAGDPVAA
jgi:MraZ protein